MYLNEVGRMYKQFDQPHIATRFYLAATELMSTLEEYSPAMDEIQTQTAVLSACALDTG